MPAAARPRSVRVPSDMAVTVRSLAGLAARFTTADLGTLVDLLIAQLDGREPDPDVEPGADSEPDPELCVV